jgi:hypothetical protein
VYGIYDNCNCVLGIVSVYYAGDWMKCNVSVTFEHKTRAPDYVKIEDIEATHPHTAASRAMRLARKKVRFRGWDSIVVLIERVDADVEDEV